MAINIAVDTNIEEELEKAKELLKCLNDIKETAKSIHFVSIKEFAEITGWSERTVQELYNKKDFPSTDYGKEKKAEVHAIVNYFSVPRRK